MGLFSLWGVSSVTRKCPSTGRWAHAPPRRLQPGDLVTACWPPSPVCPWPLPLRVAGLPASVRFLTLLSLPLWLDCSTCPGVTDQSLSALRHYFHVTVPPHAELTPGVDSHITFPHLVSLLFHLFGLCQSIFILLMPKGLEFNFPPDFILREWY